MNTLGIYLFLGSDRQAKLERIHKLEQVLDVGLLDSHRIAAQGLDPAAVIALCRQRASIAKARLVVIDDGHRLTKVTVELLTANSAVIAQNACVVILVDVELKASHPLSKVTKCWNVQTFAETQAKAFNPFALCEALGRAQVSQVIAALQEHYRVGRDPLEVLGLIAWQVQRWAWVKRLQDQGASARTLAQVMALRDWQARKLLDEVARRSQALIDRLLERCWQVEDGIKTGRLLAQPALEQLVVQICIASD